MVSMTLSTDGWKYNSNYHRMAGFFGIDQYKRNNFELAKKIFYIKDLAKEVVGSDNIKDILNVVDIITHEMEITHLLGTTLVKEMYKKLRLKEDFMRDAIQQVKLSSKVTTSKTQRTNIAQAIKDAIQPIMQQSDQKKQEIQVEKPRGGVKSKNVSNT